MLDIVIRGGDVVDGTGTDRVRADVGIAAGRIVRVGDVEEDAAETIDASGAVVAPGFIDPHTHYDAQLMWDAEATPSNVHGVTTIIGGNCGFTLAPLAPDDADYIRRMMAKVEGMSLTALEQGVDWSWRTFDEYLGRLDEIGLAVNAAFLVGHCALRRHVMGSDSVGGPASDTQIAAMRSELAAAIDAGGIGFSSTMSFTHSDGDGEPVPSRHATRAEILALCDIVGRHEGTTLEFVIDGCLRGFSDDEIDMLATMSTTADRPLNWNVLTVDSADPDAYRRQMEATAAAADRGGAVVALTMPILVGMNMSFGRYCAFNSMPGWGEILGLPIPERIQRLRDPDTRLKMLEGSLSKEAGVFRRLAEWSTYRIGDTFSAANEGLKGRFVAEIAEERGTSAFGTLLDIAIEDDLRTVLWPNPPDDDDESWALRAELWREGSVLIGGSDAGAHLDRMLGTVYPTAWLADTIRGRGLVSMERAVQMMTDEPARLFGLRERGRITDGWHADLVVFDPQTVDAEEMHLVADLPGGGERLFAGSKGVRAVLVNGVVTVEDGAATGKRPAGVLRSGRDTATVTAKAWNDR